MLKRSMLLMLVAVLSLAPATLSAAGTAEDLHGRWALQTVEVAGETEDAPEGAMEIEFHADGTIKMFQEGQEADSGTYSVQGDQLTVTTNSDGQTESTGFTVDGDSFVLKIEVAPGTFMNLNFTRTGDVQNRKALPVKAVAQDASDVHGRWELKSFSVNGEVVESPEAGMYIVEFYPDGTMKAYEEGELSDEGTYSVENGEITVSVEGQEPEGTAFTRDGNKLVISMEMGPDMKGEVVFERLGDAGTQ